MKKTITILAISFLVFAIAFQVLVSFVKRSATAITENVASEKLTNISLQLNHALGEVEMETKSMMSGMFYFHHADSVRKEIFFYVQDKDIPTITNEEMFILLSDFLSINPHFHSAFFAFEPNMLPDNNKDCVVPMLIGGDKTEYYLNDYCNIKEEEFFNTYNKSNWVTNKKSEIDSTDIITYFFPVYREDGRRYGVFGANISKSYLEEILRRNVTLKKSFINIKDKYDRLILSTNAEEKDLSNYISFSYSSSSMNWTTTIYYNKEDIYKGVKHITLIMWIISAIGMLIMFFCSFFIYRQVLEATRKKAAIDKEISLAANIQTEMLPPGLFNLDSKYEKGRGIGSVKLRATLKPAKKVGGDLYDYIYRGNRLYFCIGDVSGKGLPAALMMTQICSLFRNISKHLDEPGTIMNEINSIICEHNEQMMFCTMIIGILDLATGKLTFCNGGHNKPVIRHKKNGKGKWRFLDTNTNIPIGVEKDFCFISEEIQLADNSNFMVYTDGVTEATDVNKNLFGETQFLNTLNKGEILLETLSEFTKDAEQSDDITILSFHYKSLCKTTEPHHLTIANNLEEIHKLDDYLGDIAKKYDIDSKTIFKTKLSLEEAISNIILYAYPKDESHTINIETKIKDSGNNAVLEITVKDKGKPFNPTSQTTAPDLTSSPEERKIGGLGVYLIKQNMDDVSYERIDDTNILCMTKRI